MERLKAVLLIGGLGTRLRPLTNDRPKSTVPVLNRPVLEHTLAYLKKYGVSEVILTLNYLPEVIKQHFGDGERFGVKLSYFIEEEPRGTAGAVKNAESHLKSTFFVLNGDVFTNLNLTEMLTYHRQKNAQATIALTWVDNPSAYGVVETDKKGQVKAFIEKPPPGKATTNWINAGTYILEPEVLGEIPSGVNHMFEKGLFPHMLETGKPVYGYPFKGYWLDMGTPVHYYSINMDMMNSRIKSLLYNDHITKPFYNKKAVDIDASAVIQAPAYLGDGCMVGPNVKINGPVAIGQDCRIDEGAVIEKSILWDGVTIGAGSQVTNCIISSGTMIGEGQKVENSIITPGQTLPLLLAGNTQK